jgi:ParB-like chromosome segregation protein Spo0J
VVTARARTAQFEGQLRESNHKVGALRRQISNYELRHRSLVAILGLYLDVKADQMRKAWAFVLRHIRKSP